MPPEGLGVTDAHSAPDPTALERECDVWLAKLARLHLDADARALNRTSFFAGASSALVDATGLTKGCPDCRGKTERLFHDSLGLLEHSTRRTSP